MHVAVEEKIWVRIVRGKFALSLWIQETDLVQRNPDSIYQVLDALGGTKDISDIVGISAH